MLMLWVAISLVTRFASGSCLPDAIPPSQRQNLVNGNGETYPVGIFACNWAASFATNLIAATIVEEVLGFNVTLNLDAPGEGSVAGYYGITGCRDPNNVSDRGCNQGVTYYHFQLEAWMGLYPNDWRHIQDTYASMAPKDLGSHGYMGLVTMYIPAPIQNQAYTTKGKALEWYREWNVSWNDPAAFFGSTSTVTTSKLKPCNSSESGMTDDPMMRRHVQMTGDLGGVVIKDDMYSARCDDGFWWRAPSCRQTGDCVPWLTGGPGWGLEEFMQKFTVFHMPCAIAVSKSWTDYTQLPLSGDMSFFWWSPDPTFLELNPVPVDFPDHKATEFARNIQTSQSVASVISAIASPDLAILAPLIESFADKVEMPQSTVDAILLDQKDTADTWQDVTCRWLKANRAVWQTWIPDESNCFPGFGLYDSVLHDFVDARTNASNKIVCQACPAGRFSQIFEDNEGTTYVCVPCGKGTSQDSGASLSCKPCKTGEYQDEVESKECKRCAIGMYQDEVGQVGCKACPASTNTLGLGSRSESYCGCPENYINMDTSGAFNCAKCMEGLECPALSQLVVLKYGESDIPELPIPRVKPGYYSQPRTPTEVYRCENDLVCPGGKPRTCAKGRTHAPCSRCAEGSTWTGTSCEDCGRWRQALWALAVVGTFAFLILAYYLTASKVTAKASVLFATTASVGMLVMSMQNLGLISMMTVEWPHALQGMFSICKFMLLDIDSYGFVCVAGQKEVVRYILKACIFPSGVAWLILAYAVSQLFPGYRWEGPKVCSTIGAFLQVGFSTMSATALSPLMCYHHPNGKMSLLEYTGVMCGSEQHQPILVTGIIILTVFVLGFVALCLYAACKVPSWSIEQKNDRVAAFRFLIFRFRFDAWWFGVPLLIRGPLISLPAVLATDHPSIQVVSIAMVLTAFMVMQMLAWPWKVPLLNFTDCTVSCCIVLLVTTSSMYLRIDDQMSGFAEGVTTAMLSGICLAVVVMFSMTVTALFHRTALGSNKELSMFSLGSVPDPGDIAKTIKELAEELEIIETAELSSKLQGLSVFDIKKVTTWITLMATEVAPPSENGGSFKYMRRIASASFDPSLKKKETRALCIEPTAEAIDVSEAKKDPELLTTPWM